MISSSIKLLTLGAICFSLFMVNLDDTAVNVGLPSIQKSLGADVSQLQWVLNAYTLLCASFVLIIGTLGDLYGRKRVFLAGLVTFITGSAVCGFSPIISSLIAGRALQGIGAAALLPGAIAILTDMFPDPKENAKAIGTCVAVSGLALIAGPALGGILVDTLGWQSIFFVNVPIGIFTFIVAARMIQSPLNVKSQRLDVPGLLLSIISLASFSYALIEGNSLGWRSPLIICLLTVAVLSFLIFFPVELYSANAILPLHFFSNSTFTTANVIGILVFFTLSGIIFLFSLFLQNVQGYSAMATGVRFLPLSGAFVLTSLFSGWLTAKFGFRTSITTGLTTSAIALLLLLQVSVNKNYGLIGWNFILIGIGFGLVVAPRTALAMSTVPQTYVGIASAVLNASNRLGNLFGIALPGALLTGRITSNLKRELATLGIPANTQNRIIADVIHGHTGSAGLPLVDIAQGNYLHQAIGNAFVEGIHITLLIYSIALLTGAFLTWLFLAPIVER